MNFLKKNRLITLLSFFISMNSLYAVEIKKSEVLSVSDVKEKRIKAVAENETKVLETGFDWLFEEKDEASKDFKPYFDIDFDLSIGTNLGLKFDDKGASYTLGATPFAGIGFEIYPTTYLTFGFDLGIGLAFTKDPSKKEYQNTVSTDKMVFEHLASKITSTSLYMDAILVDVFCTKSGYKSNYTLSTSLGFINTPVFFSLPNGSPTSQYTNRVGSLIGKDNAQIVGAELLNKYMMLTESKSAFYTELSITAGKSSQGLLNGNDQRSDMAAGLKLTFDYTTSTEDGFDYEFDPYNGNEAISTSLVFGGEYRSRAIIPSSGKYVEQYLQFGVQYGIQYSIFSMLATYTNSFPVAGGKEGKTTYGSFYELEGIVHIIPKMLLTSLRVGLKRPVTTFEDVANKPGYFPSEKAPWDMIAGLSFGLYPLKNTDIKVVLEAAYIKQIPFDNPENKIDLGLYVAFSF